MEITLRKAAQWGVVVRDIDEAMLHWSRLLGVGPFMHIQRIALHEHEARYHGIPSDVQLTVAFSYYGETQLEIIQQLNDAPSPYVDFLVAGHSGLQHVGFWSDDYDGSYAGLIEEGYVPVYTARMRGVPRETTYFTDSSGCFGPMLELSLMTTRKAALFAAMAERVRDWSGGAAVERYESMDELANVLGTASWAPSG
jgi:hypothetical protein